jgi:cation transport protein ChaC
MLSGAYRPTWIAAPVEEGRILGFVIDRDHPRYEGDLAEEAIAARIAASEGVLGTNRDYLYRTARHLAECGVDDEEIFRLERRVRALTGEPPEPFEPSKGETP